MMNAAKTQKPKEQTTPRGAAISDSQSLLDAFDALAAADGLAEIIQEIADQLALQAKASGAALLQWFPEERLFRLRGRHPAIASRPVSSTFDSIEVQPNALMEGSLESQQIWQGPLSDLADSNLREALQLTPFEGAALLKPVLYQNEPRGLALVWDQDDTRRFTLEETTMLRVFLRHASIALENSLLLQTSQQDTRELEALRQASLYLTSSLDLKEVLHAILESVMRLVGNVLDAHIFLFDGLQLSFGAAMWSDGRMGESWSEPRRDGLTYTVAESGEMVVVPDMRVHPLYSEAPEDWTGAIIGTPLRMANQVVGVMNVAYEQARQFSPRELRQVMLLADHAAIAIHNARQHGLSQEQAHTDPLTGLPNRRAFDQHIQDEIRRSARYGHSFCLVMMDLDGFKRVNDRHGHQMGDTALKDIAHCLRYRVRGTDFLARFGGDEFVLILPETKSGDAAIIAEKLQAAVTECGIQWGDKSVLDITLSVGVASFPRDGEKAEQLIRVADQGLYRRKNT